MIFFFESFFQRNETKSSKISRFYHELMHVNWLILQLDFETFIFNLSGKGELFELCIMFTIIIASSCSINHILSQYLNYVYTPYLRLEGNGSGDGRSKMRPKRS